MKLVVTGAAGRLGRLVTDRLLARVPAEDLILVSRDPGALADAAAKGARVRRGDFEIAEGLAEAFRDGDRMLLIGTHGKMDRVAMHQNAIDAAKAAGIRHISFVSWANPSPENPAFPSATNRAIEQAIRDSGLGFTMLRDAIYSELRFEAAPAYRAAGKITTNMGAGRHAYVWREDCAAAAAAALREPRFDGRVFEVTGPELLDVEDYRRLIEEFGGKPVVVEPISDDDHPAYLEAYAARHHLPNWMPELHTSTGIAIREGHLAQLTDAVEELTGRKPRTLRQMFEARRAELDS